MKEFKSHFLKLIFSCVVFVIGCKTNEQDVQQKIQNKFLANTRLSKSEVHLTDSVATLSGNVNNDSDKISAERIAKNEQGVRSVNNQINISHPETTPGIQNDKALHDGVISVTSNYKDVTATVHDGLVTLKGSIKKANVADLMHGLDSLKPKKIDNELSVEK
jgi:hyperosmotically inducible protein